MPKRIIAGILGVLIGNQAAYPISQSIAANNRFANDSREVIQTGRFDSDCLAPYNNLRAIDYLNLAHKYAIAHSNESHLCRHLAESTFDTFMKIIDVANRPDLKESIKIAANNKHMWVKYEHKGEWNDFESVNRNCVAGDIGSLRDFSDENIETRKVLAGGEQYAHSTTAAGTKDFYPTQQSVLFPGGLLRLMAQGTWEVFTHNGGIN